jgi:asparagine synthase (glutamine-hydrolysing)
MCGIVGSLSMHGQPVNLGALLDSLHSIQHRGPDDEGYLLVNTVRGNVAACSGPDSDLKLGLPRIEQCYDEQFDLAFGFRRLSILDLSPAGHQPMSSADGSLWIVFNGEIYNYIELRAELKARGYKFRTQTDTEVILNAYLEWGTACLKRFNGMWALAIYDKDKNRLFCARDRFGIKPLYYFFDRERFVFASEIKALLSYVKIDRKPNNASVYDYLAYGMIDHTEDTFFEGVKQLSPSHYLLLDAGNLTIQRYWDLDPRNKLELGHNPQADLEYARRFYELFEDSIMLHLRSDVAIGSCLSGGLDSSSIVCLANKLLFADRVVSPEIIGEKQKTFSSCFDDPRFDERPYIECVLSATSAEANYTFPNPKDLLDELPKLIWHQEEPFGSTSIYAQWCVMKIAAQQGVRVLLDGQGGDEILAGYHTYFDAYWAALAGRGQAGKLLQEWSSYRRLFGVPLSYLFQHTLFALAPAGLQRRVRSKRGSPGMNPQFAGEFSNRDPDENIEYAGNSLSQRLYLFITKTSLPGLLHYEDRNSMAHSIEARVPFLDYRLVEYAFSLPDDQKIKRGYTKSVLRNAMKDTLPENIRMRTDKMGFVTPERAWLSNDLRTWLDDVIDSSSFRTREYFDHPEITRLINEHRAGKRDLGFMMWRWANLELWLNTVVKAPPAS